MTERSQAGPVIGMRGMQMENYTNTKSVIPLPHWNLSPTPSSASFIISAPPGLHLYSQKELTHPMTLQDFSATISTSCKQVSEAAFSGQCSAWHKTCCHEPILFPTLPPHPQKTGSEKSMVTCLLKKTQAPSRVPSPA